MWETKNCSCARLELIRLADVSYTQPEAKVESESYSTIDAIAEQRRAQSRSRDTGSPKNATSSPIATPDAEPAAVGSPGELEQEAEQQGAFNEETGEINWDCPCLGGMAHGVCGEQFRAAFSCFVYSKEEPKGVDCIENFKAMQNCFREHPDIYGAELEDEDVALPEEGESERAGANALEGSVEPAKNAASEGSRSDREQARNDVQSAPAPTTGARP
jgi:intermembrane space import and assembly protein 40